MKILKFNESIENKPKIGDYVVILNMYRGEFERDLIAKISEIDKYDKSYITYKIIELNNPDIYHWIELSEMDYFSKNIEDIKTFIAANKYNL